MAMLNKTVFNSKTKQKTGPNRGKLNVDNTITKWNWF